MPAGVEVRFGPSTLTFVLPPLELVTFEVPDAFVGQIWFLIELTADEFRDVLYRELLSWRDESWGIHLWFCVNLQSTGLVSESSRSQHMADTIPAYLQQAPSLLSTLCLAMFFYQGGVSAVRTF